MSQLQITKTIIRKNGETEILKVSRWGENTKQKESVSLEVLRLMDWLGGTVGQEIKYY
jgi:hypothetical protein